MPETPTSWSKDRSTVEPDCGYTDDVTQGGTVEPDNVYHESLYALLASAGTVTTGASVVAKAAIEKRAVVRQAEIEAETARLEIEAETERTRIQEASETERERLRQQGPLGTGQ
jgi:hypothetical protein